ncbi:MAG: PIN domain-containing protein [Cellulomonadaceae bacterium]|jgi:toxin-antitoxin system PIN domain toxin|nr:PIN domain-containing protein [Cellulomonadaceae bacterium]
MKTKPTALLDANVLIALAIEDHEFHQAADQWLASQGRVAVCPIVEGALVRFLTRIGQSRHTITSTLEGMHNRDSLEFWPDDVSYRDVDLSDVVGHRQVTDSYLAALARHHSGVLATFDEALARRLPDHVELIDARL